MKFKHLTLTIVFVLACATPSIAQKIGSIDRDYDRFEDKTLFQLDFMQVTGGKFDGVAFNASFQCKGDVRYCAPERVYLGIVVVLKGAIYDQPANLIILADSERFPLGNMKRIQTAKTNEAWDIIATSFLAPISRDNFLKIAKAKRVEMRLDNIEFELTMEHRTALYSISTLATL